MSWAVLLFFGVLSLLCYGAVSLFEHNILFSVIDSKCTRVPVYFTLTVFMCATGLCVHKWKCWLSLWLQYDIYCRVTTLKHSLVVLIYTLM